MNFSTILNSPFNYHTLPVTPFKLQSCLAKCCCRNIEGNFPNFTFFPHLDERKIYYLNFQFRNECTVVKKKIKKYSPETTCEKIPTELCAPPGCGFKEVTWIPNHGNYVTSVSLNMAIM